MALVTARDLEGHLRRQFDERERKLADELIARVEDEVESQVLIGRPLAQRTVTQTINVAPGARFVALAKTPVVSVQSMTVDGSAVDATEYVVSRSGLEFEDDWFSNAFGPVMVVTYVAGLDPEVAAGMKQTIMNRMARSLNKTLDDAVGASSVGEVSYEPEGFTKDELEFLRSFAYRVAV